MKPLKKCENGHYYDSEKHTVCPFCGVQELIDVRSTMAQKREDESNDSIPVTRPQGLPGMSGKESKTVGIIEGTLGINPVVGWVVAISGPAKGRDYRIVAEKNTIGRSEQMDISLSQDETVSRDSHAIISYDPKNNIYRIYPGESKSLVYLNDEEVTSAKQLKPYDIIEVGNSKLLFVPLCSDKYQWEKEKDDT